MIKTAFVFPGQGSQWVGMGADLISAFPDYSIVFKKANDILGYDLLDICLNGPQEKLDSTLYSQPAIFTMSAAILPMISVQPHMFAGLSLGEYTALYAAGYMSFEEALLLVQQRAVAMNYASKESDGAMACIIGLKLTHVKKIIEESISGTWQTLECSNFNCPGQIIISGNRDSCIKAINKARKEGALKAEFLKVSGAFHTKMMMPALPILEDALDSCDIIDFVSNEQVPQSTHPVMCNAWARPYCGASTVRRGLAEQLIKPVLWQECIERMILEGITRFIEIGPGRTLTGLIKKIDRKMEVINVSTFESLIKL